MRISDWSSDVCSSDLAEIAPAKWADPDEPEYFERDCYDLGKAFDACLVEAGLTRPVIGADGNPVFLPARRKLGETESRPKLRGRGTPNTLRHTIITEMHARGVAEAQIEAAAGHRSEEHTSELQSLMRISYAVFCLKKKKSTNNN